ncbi:MAG: phytoene desaturase family protein [Patescibacteria group bacterium]
MNRKTKIAIVGAGPGGLAATMLLAYRGFDVEVFEKADQPGGRTSELKLGDYRFDVGPTFFMMKFVLDEIFKESGGNSEKVLDFIRLAPMYRLILPDNEKLDVYENKNKMKSELKRVFPGEENGLDKFYDQEKKRFDHLMPILQANNSSLDLEGFNNIFKSIPYFAFGRSIFQEMGKYFKSDLARLSFTFQSKYLGMSPWECPAAFGLVPYVEHAFGVYHVKGGLSEITRQMAAHAEKLGAKIKYKTSVKQIIVKDGQAKGVILSSDKQIEADEVIVNADFGYAMENLFPKGIIKKYSPKKLKKKKISCSIFMLYLGLNKQYDLEHNTIVFAKDYKKNVDDVFGGRLTAKDISFYVRNTAKTDPDLAPKGKTPLYVLVPVPNLRSDIDWQKVKKKVRQDTIESLKTRLGLSDIEDHIEEEKIYSPQDWQDEFNVYEGAVFNLAHNLSQMLWLRPHNDFEELEKCYLVGGGTHPGSGLPTIFESGRITSKLICEKHNVKYE